MVRPLVGIRRVAGRDNNLKDINETHKEGWLRNLRVSVFLVLLAAIGWAGTQSFAQEFRGTISGSVTDASGAVISGADVTLVETHTGTTNHVTSDAAGQYVVPFLLPGNYDITVKAAGFESLKHTGVTLQAQDHLNVNLALQVGRVSSTVTVSGEAPLIDTANASVGQVISTQSVADLPVNGRTPTTLTELSEGVISTAPPQLIHPFDNNAGNSWSIGGTPNQVSEVLLDGSPDLTLLGALAYAPTEDSVAEVSVRPFDTDASFGHTIGGVINQVTKGGTNQLHGTAYEFGQISGIDANTYFNNRSNQPLPVFHFNQYGLTVGGPVWIPHVYNGRNKLFFFFAWEGLKDSSPATITTTVPTAAEKGGDFSQLLTAGCSGGAYTVNTSGVAICNSTGKADPNQLYNPFKGSLNGSGAVVRPAIPNNDLGSAIGAFNPVALAYLKLFPGANNSAGADADGHNNYVSNAPSVDTYDNEFGRLDYNLSSRDHIFFDFRHNNRFQTKNNYFGNGITGTTLLRGNFGSSLDNVFTLNPTTFFDTRLNWTFFNEVHGTPSTQYSPASVGLPSNVNNASTLKQLPFINFAGPSGASCGSFVSYQCLGDTGSALDPTTSYQIFTDMVKIIGKHTLKVGFDGRQYRMSIQNFGDSSGSFTFNSSWMTTSGVSAQSFGADLASFMLGLPSSGDFVNAARADYHQYYVGTFVQDDWKVSSRLTLNLGVRFDIDTPFEERLGRTVNGFDPTAGINYAKAPSFSGATVTNNASPDTDGSSFSVPSINTAGGLTFSKGKNGAVYATNGGFFSPRFGFSFAADSRDVIRGGFGTFVQPETLSNLSANGGYSSSAISNQQGFTATTPFVGSTNNNLTPVTPQPFSDPFPNGFVPAAGSSLGASTNLGSSISFLAPVQHDPYSERWDLGVQHELTHNTLIDVLYVGNHALHLPVSARNLNAMEYQYLAKTPWRDQDIATAYGKSVSNPFKGTLPAVEGVANSSGTNTSSSIAISNLMYPYPQFGSSSVTEQNQTIGQSWFNSGIIHIEQRASHGLTLTANYSFSKMIERDSYLNDQDANLTTRISPFDHTHHFTVGGTYALPFGNGKAFAFGGSRLWDEIAGGFVLNAVYQFQTGAPIYFSSDIPLQAGASLRQMSDKPRDTAPTSSGNPALSTNLFVTGNNSQTCTTGAVCDGSQFFNGQYSNHYRTFPQTLSWVRSDGYNNLDASVLKNFHFTEGDYFQLRFESFNALNHAVFSPPNISSATSSSFGYISSTIANSLPRQFQIGGRLVF